LNGTAPLTSPTVGCQRAKAENLAILGEHRIVDRPRAAVKARGSSRRSSWSRGWDISLVQGVPCSA